MMGGIRHSKTAQNWARYEFSHFSGPETVQSMYVNSVGKIKLLSQWPKNGGPFRKTALTLPESLLHSSSHANLVVPWGPSDVLPPGPDGAKFSKCQLWEDHSERSHQCQHHEP